MFERSFTAGAQRIVASAADLATAADSEHVEPVHLLWALVLDESKAADVLSRRGLSRDLLHKTCPLDVATQQTASSPSSTEAAKNSTTPRQSATPGRRPEYSQTTERVLLEAQQKVALVGRNVEISSEHLLWGLVAVESRAADVLADLDISVESLSVILPAESVAVGEPLEVDFHLKFGDGVESASTMTLRVIDAAANRAREGIRVVEDFVRFTLDDAHLTRRLKNLRHALTESLSSIGSTPLLAARETLRDVGTNISNASERRRSSPIDVVQANCKRVEEALRTLEEFGKLLPQKETVGTQPPLGEQLGQIRYQFYTLEKAVLLTIDSQTRLVDKDLYLLATESLCGGGFEATVRAALAAGVGIVQLREKSMSDRELVERGKRLRKWTQETGALFVMNDRPDLAVLTEADGVHVGQEELTAHEARRIVGPDRLVGISTHTIEQARQAVLDGADYIGVGPVFESSTKQFEDFAGLQFVVQVADEIALPWFAIGGINASNINEVRLAGATRVAVSGAICGGEEPDAATRQLLRSLRRTVPSR